MDRHDRFAARDPGQPLVELRVRAEVREERGGQCHRLEERLGERRPPGLFEDEGEVDVVTAEAAVTLRNRDPEEPGLRHGAPHLVVARLVLREQLPQS